MSPIKIAFIHASRSSFSGAQKNIFRLLRRIDQGKLEPVLITQSENELTKRVKELGIKTFIVPFPAAFDVYERGLLKVSIGNVLRTLAAFWKYHVSIVPVLKVIRPPVIWCDSMRTFFTVYAASKRVGGTVIWNNWSEPEGRVFWFLHRLALLLADVVNLEYYGQGQKLFGSLANSRFFRRKLVTLYTGVTDFDTCLGSDIRGELNLSSSDILIIMASNIVRLKGQIDLLRALEILVNTFSNLHLLLAGKPLENHSDSLNYYSVIKQYASQLKLSHHVHFLGWRSDIRDLLQASDIYVSTSYSESFPDAVREAMSVGKPVVATNVGGTFEIVNAGKTGFLFKAGDAHSLAGYLHQLILNPELRSSMGAEGARIIAENFSMESYARNFENMVLKVFDR